MRSLLLSLAAALLSGDFQSLHQEAGMSVYATSALPDPHKVGLGVKDLCFTQDSETCAMHGRGGGHECIEVFIAELVKDPSLVERLPALRIFYDVTEHRIVSLDNRRLSAMKAACSEHPKLAFCLPGAPSLRLQWASKRDVECTANSRDGDLSEYVPPDQNPDHLPCKELDEEYNGNHWSSANDGATIDIHGRTLQGMDWAKKLGCKADYTIPSAAFQCGALSVAQQEKLLPILSTEGPDHRAHKVLVTLKDAVPISLVQRSVVRAEAP